MVSSKRCRVENRFTSCHSGLWPQRIAPLFIGGVVLSAAKVCCYNSGRPMPRLSIIVPTYKEARSLPELTQRIAAAFREEPYDFEIIVVDDNSPDNTVQVCNTLSATFPLRLHVRTAERGLSSAVIAGMKLAEGEIFICMDADLSHPPESLPELVAALENPQTDFVIGSRYVRGGSTEEGWGMFRWLNSKIATWLAMPLTSTSDPMAGFFGLRRETFLAARDLNPVGYKIGLELLVKCGCEKVVEVPIRFANRVYGTSKLSFREQMNYLRHLRRLYRFRFSTLAKVTEFLLVGSSGVIVDLGSLSLLLTILPFNWARPVAILLAMTWNFALNRTFTFADARSSSLIRQYLRFVSACSLGAISNWIASVTMLPMLLDTVAEGPLVAAATGVFIGATFNFLLCSRFVFPRIQNVSDLAVAPSTSPHAEQTRRSVENRESSLTR